MKYVVAIVEDSIPFQQALRQLISETPEFICGKVYGSAEQALEMAGDPPDIAIVDIQLPGMSGIDLISRMTAQKIPASFLVCSMYEDDDKIMQALEHGASGYILKDRPAAEIKAALNDLIKGGAPMSPYIAKRVISFFRKPVPREGSGLLSDREQEVLDLLARGLQYKEIAARLYISSETVKKHIRNIYHKLQVQNKVEALNKFRSL